MRRGVVFSALRHELEPPQVIAVIGALGEAGFAQVDEDPVDGRAIDALIGAGLMPPGARRAHDVLTRLLVTLRLVAPDATPPSRLPGQPRARRP